MQIEEMKKSMSVLEQLLAKTNTDIKIDVAASETARKKILKRYRQGIISSGVLALVFMISWLGKGIMQSFATYQRAFLAIYLAAAALWYLFLYIKLRQINVSQLSPIKLLEKSTRLKIYTFSGEAVATIGLAVFFALFTPDLLEVSPLAFWMCIITLAVGLTSSAVFYLPKYFRLFSELNSIKE